MAKTTIPGGYIADNAITGDHIADNVITSAMLHTSFTVSSSNLSSIDTDSVSEGSTNLYYTDARARGAISVSGDLSYNSSTGVISFTNDAGDIESVVAGSGLTGGGLSGDVTLNIGAGTGITVNADDIAVNMSAFDTDNLSEGSTNLYFTNARADARIAAATTDDLTEGSTNLYYTTARWDTKMAAADTDDLSEGSSNLYYTDARVGSYLSTNGYATQSTIVAAITDSAPATLDTLNELAAALGDDANFSTTVTNSIATKLPLAGGTMTGALNMGSQNITNAGTISSGVVDAIVSNDASGLIVSTLGDGGGASNTGLAIVPYASGGILRTVGTNRNMLLQIGTSTALTINSSLNATFAGTINSGAITASGDVAVSNGVFKVGTENTTSGAIDVYGGSSGVEGGEIRLHTTNDYDSTYEWYRIDAYQDDLRIGREGTVDITLDSSGNTTFAGTISSKTILISSATGTYQAGSLGYTDSNWGFLYRPPQAGAQGAHLFEATDGTDLLKIEESGNATFTGTISSGAITSSGNLVLDASDHNYIELHSSTANTRKWRFYNGQAWNPDALLIYDQDADSTALTIETNKLGIARGANSLSHTLDVGGNVAISGTEIITSSRNLTNIGTISSGAITANTDEASSIPLEIGSSASTNYTLQRWITSAHSGSSAYMIAYGASHASFANDFAMKNLVSGGDIYFQLANDVEPLRLTSTGATFAGEITANGGIALGTNDKATFGASDTFEIYTDGTDSYIKETAAGSLKLLGTNIDLVNAAGTELGLRFITNDAVTLYYDGSPKIATTSTGIDVTGTAVVDALTSSGTIVSNASSGISITTADATYAKIKQATSSADVLELTSFGSMQFAIDSNNNSSNKYFIWKDGGEGTGGTEYMTLSDQGNLAVMGDILLTGTATTTNQGRMIDFTGFDKEGVTDFSDRAYIQHTTGTAGHSGSVLVFSSQNDADDGIGFITHASSNLKHNSNTIWTAGNDGSGSGLDADTVDGIQGANFLRSDVNDTCSGLITFSQDISVGSQTGTWITSDVMSDAIGWNTNYGVYIGSDIGGTHYLRGNGTFTTGGSTYNLWHTGNDGSGSGLDADTLDGVQASNFLRSNVADTATQAITFSGGIVVDGSIDSGGTDYGFYQSDGTNIILKGDASGRSGIFFQSEKNGTNINHPSDYGFIQFHSYGYGGSSGEAIDMVIGTANDSTDHLILQTPYTTGLKFGYRNATSGTGLTQVNIWHAANDGSGSGLDADTLDGINSGSFLRSDADDTLTGHLQINSHAINMDLNNVADDAITMREVRSSTWPLQILTNAVGNDNHSGFWVGSNGYPDMRLRRDNSTVRALISSWETSYVSNGFNVAGGNLQISGTTVIDSSRNLTNILSITSAGTHQITSVSTSFNPFLVRYNSTYSNNNLARIRQDGAASIFNLYNSAGTSQVQFGTNTNNYLLNGNTGIGTSSPSVKFHVVATGANSQFYFQSPTPTIRLVDSNLTTRYCEIGGENGSCNIAVDPGNAEGSSAFGVTIDGQQALYIDSDDRNYINTSSNPTPSNATGHLNVLSDLGDGVNIKHTINGNNTINIWQTGTTVHSAMAFYKGNTQAVRGTIRVDTNGTSYTSSSDYRLKENIIPLPNATTRLMAINPVQFNWIESGDTAEGFIAHELAEQYPGAVVGEKDAVFGNGDINPQEVDYGKITPLLVKTIQEQQALIESLQTRIEALEGE